LEADLLRLITRINERVVPLESLAIKLENDEQTLEGLDDIQVTEGLQTGKRFRQPGCRRQERLEAARNTLSNWCQTVWKLDYRHCIWGPEILLPDTVLTKLASRARIKSVSDIKKEVPEWLWADEYGATILRLLEPIDSAWHDENERKKEENKAKRAKASADKKVKREEDRLVKARQVTVQRRASQVVPGSQSSMQQHQSVFACSPLAVHSDASTGPSTYPYSSTLQAGGPTGMFYSFQVALEPGSFM
jgi:ribosomal protein L27